MKKYILHSLILISMGAFLTACRSSPEPTSTSTSLTTLTVPNAPTLNPTLSSAELFYELSQNWKVVFVDATSRMICVMQGDGSSKSCLDYQDYDYPGGFRRKLGCWSPDGNRFVYDRNDDSGIFIWENTGTLTAFHASEEGLVYREPFCSTDGNYIAYQVVPVANWDITTDVPGTYIETLDHSYKIRISPDNVSVDWSPGGNSTLFSDGDLYAAMADGTNPRKITLDGTGYSYPRWSPDGLQIAFIRRAGSMNELYVMNADGSGIRKITSVEIRNSYSMFNYIWLPEAGYILYNNELINVKTGISSELSFAFDASCAVWFTKPVIN